jgi:hypothetical protein
MKNSFQFSDSYRTVDWDSLIRSANNTIVIAVFYWDKWVKEHEEALSEFLSKPDARIQFIFSNALDEVLRLFPGYSLEALQHKIEQTYKPLQNRFGGKVEVFHVPFPLNYSLQCFDDETLLLSFYEMFRGVQVDAPSIQIDLRQHPNTRKFYQKELQGLLNLANIGLAR